MATATPATTTRLSLAVVADGDAIYHTLSLRPRAAALTIGSENHGRGGGGGGGGGGGTTGGRPAARGGGGGDGDDDDYFDPCFFDEGYTIAAATASSVWEGSLVLLDYLLPRAAAEARRGAGGPRRPPPPLRRRRVLELGSGTGLLGLGVAFFAGGSVLCTDVASVAAAGGWLWRNSRPAAEADAGRRRRRSPNAEAEEEEEEEEEEVEEEEEEEEEDAEAEGISSSSSSSSAPHRRRRRCRTWLGARPFGRGSAADPQPLDWSVPLSRQRDSYPNDPAAADVVVAAECVWLKELAPLFVETVDAVLSTEAPPAPNGRSRRRPRRVCYWAYTERGTPESKVFTTLDEVVAMFVSRGCKVTEAHRVRSIEDPEKWVTVNVVVKET